MAVAEGVRAGEGPVRLDGRLRLVLVVLLVAQFMLAVDFSILNVALPVIGDGLGFSLSGLQWIATSFALAAAGFTLLFGRIADLFGRSGGSSWRDSRSSDSPPWWVGWPRVPKC